MLLVIYNWPTLSQCSYPSWLLNSSWRDLPGKHRLSAEEDRRDSLLLTNFRKTGFSAASAVQDHVFAGYRCLLMDSDGDDLIVLSHVVEAWSVMNGQHVRGVNAYGCCYTFSLFVLLLQGDSECIVLGFLANCACPSLPISDAVCLSFPLSVSFSVSTCVFVYLSLLCIIL